MPLEPVNQLNQPETPQQIGKLFVFLQAFATIGAAFGPAFVHSTHAKQLLLAGEQALAIELGLHQQ